MRWSQSLAAVLVLATVVGTPAAAFAYNGWLHSHQGAREVVLVAGPNSIWRPNEIRVRQGEKVRLLVTSHDAVHGFVLGGYGIATNDVYPGEYTIVEFVADKVGTFPFLCSVVCGPNHQRMQGQLVVEPAGGGMTPGSRR